MIGVLSLSRRALGLREGGGSRFELALERLDALEGLGVGFRRCGGGEGVCRAQAAPKLVGLSLGLLETARDLGIRRGRGIRPLAQPLHLGRRGFETGLGARRPGLGVAFPGLGVARSLFDVAWLAARRPWRAPRPG